MIFKQKYYDEIFLKGLQNSYENKLISRQEDFVQYVQNREDIENFYVMLLSIHAEWLADAYVQMKNYRDGDFISTATGSDLDNIGERVGIARKQASYAYCDLVFTTSKKLDEDLVIPAGTLVTSKKGNVYKTNSKVTLNAETTSATAVAYSTVAGVAGRADKDTLTSCDERGVSVTNPSNSSGGEDAQTDSEYREYLKNWTIVQQKGNEWAYKYHLNKYDGLDGYGLLPCWDGAGTVKVIVDRGDNTSADYLNNLYNYLIDNVCLFDDDVIVVDATKKAIDVSIVVDVDIDQINPFSRTEKDEIATRTQAAVKTYIESLGIGEDFIPHKLSVYLDKQIPELKDIKFTYPLEYISLNSEEIASNGSIDVVIQ